MAVAEKSATPRSARREMRRAQLIEATMKCIGRKGISGTTLSDVATQAGLSQGIVNLHFESKENLLTATLASLADDYRAQFHKTLDRAGPHAADKLLAIMRNDLKPAICNPSNLAVWFAFWGEVRSRPTYRKICDEADRNYDRIAAELCQEIIDEGGYMVASADAIAVALSSITNGLWLGCLISPQAWDRHEAMQSVLSYLSALFPKTFFTRLLKARHENRTVRRRTAMAIHCT